MFSPLNHRSILCVRGIAAALLLCFGVSCANVSHVDGKLTSANEKRTINQAQAAWGIGSAIVAGGAGLLLAKLNNLSDEDAAKVAVGAGAAGYWAGRQHGQKQGEKAVQQKRAVKMEKTRLDRLIADARGYNKQAAGYNSKLRRVITELEGKKSDPAMRSAVAKRASAEAKFANKQLQDIDETIQMRGKFIKNMVPSQRAGYQNEKDSLENQRENLRQSVKKLNNIETRASGG